MRPFSTLFILLALLLLSEQAIAAGSIPRPGKTSLYGYYNLTSGYSGLSGFRLNIGQSWEQRPDVLFVTDRLNVQRATFYQKTGQMSLTPYGKPNFWPQPRLLMPHALNIKYKVPDYGKITVKPVFLSNSFLPNTSLQRFYGENRPDLLVFNEPVKSRFDTMAENVSISQPMLVRHQWNQIPSPHRFALEGVLLDKKAAQEAFRVSTIEVKRKLEKPKEEQKLWKYSGVEALQLSQTYFSNWVKGGQNSIALLSDLRANANYKKGKIEWDNKGIHKLGILNSQGERSRINDDLLLLTSKLGVNASKKWYYSTLFDFRTQFFYGRDKKDWNKILSGFMSPAYLTFAVGMDYKRKDFTLMLSPITSKTTVVLDTIHVNKARYNISPGQRSTSQTGASLNNHFKWKINTEFSLTSNMDWFYGYLNETPQTQLDWELIFDMRINRFLSTRLNTTFRYYESESKKLQLKENFSVVFSYKF